MPPLTFASFGAELWLKEDGSSSDHNPCLSPRDELKECIGDHKIWFGLAIGATVVLLCCFVAFMRHCCCAPKTQQTIQGLLEPMARQSFRYRLMRESQWRASTSVQQPLLSPASPPASLSPSTKLLAESPLLTTPLQPGASVNLRSAAQSSGLRSLWETVSGVRKGSNELINNDNFNEAEVDEDPIAAGATGDVLRGTWRGKELAIKVLQVRERTLSKAETDEVIKSFSREVQHENLVNFYGYTTSPQLRICMEFVPGGALDSALYRDSDRSGRRWVPTHAQVKECALGIARGMAWLHECGVIHRDLKSPNLLLNTRPTGPWQKDQSSRERTPVIRITDFGLSREMIPAAAQFHNHRMTMDLKVGTPVWMSPELLDQQAEYGREVDLYSFAIVVNEMLTSELPWRSLPPGRQNLVTAVLVEKRRPDIPDDTPIGLQEIMEACWQHDPARRPAFRQVQDLLEHSRLDSMSSEERAQMLRPQIDSYQAGGSYGRVASMGAASSSDEEEFMGAE